MRDLTLFFKIDSNTPMSMADFPKIAEGRWDFFRNNWDFLKTDYLAKIRALPDGPAKTAANVQYSQFSELISSNRSSSVNPLTNKSTIRKFKDLLDNILINDLPITQAERTLIDKDVQRVVKLQKDDFYQMRERVRIVHDKTADSLGLGDETYNALFDRVGIPEIITFQFSNFQILSSLIAVKDTITSMIPTTMVYNERPDPFANIRNSLNNPNIPMNSSQTGFMVPFQAGTTLPRIASQYLGTPDRWLEIAIANGLEFPYIDEVGTRVFLVINGIGSLAIVDIVEFPNFATGDEVFVGSSALGLSRRSIVSIEKDVGNGQLILTLDGANDLSKYTTVQRGFVFHYKRNTVNSDKFIMIPTQGAAGFPINAREPWFVKNLSQDQKNLGVDLAVSDDSDLIFNNNGDLQLIYGLGNATQAANLKFKIKTKELLRNPDFGIEEITGKFKNNEISESLLLLLVETALGGDDRFEGTDGFGYTMTETEIFINTSIKLAGTSSSIPLTFQIPKG